MRAAPLVAFTRTAPLRPGAHAAHRAGCRCSMVRNNYGRGLGPDRDTATFIVAVDCPRHRDGAMPLGQVPVDTRAPIRGRRPAAPKHGRSTVRSVR